MIPCRDKVPGWKRNFCSEFNYLHYYLDEEKCQIKFIHVEKWDSRLHVRRQVLCLYFFLLLNDCRHNVIIFIHFLFLSYTIHVDYILKDVKSNEIHVKSSVELWAPTLKYLVARQIWENFWSKRETIGYWVKIQPVSGS